ncbi:MAG TPA: PPOX class F420-dependent oxidoreductase [Candidatus Acidoferrum sp.]|nr:PPOX class F420-dependent oxidoreductase [Candidatus Acidoferrum sp.]
MADARFAALAMHKYLNLETFRKNGQGVRTPVWFAGEPELGTPEKVYVYSTESSGKAKRIRNSGRARVAPCTGRGKLLGEWMEARAEIVSGAEAEHGTKLLNTKYFPLKQILGFFALFSRQKRVVFLIRPA